MANDRGSDSETNAPRTDDEAAGDQAGQRNAEPTERRREPASFSGISWARGGSSVHRPLLDTLVADALDPAYAEAAERRQDRPPRARSATVALLLVGGLVVGLTVGRERTDAPAAEQARSALVGDARQRTATVTALSAQIDELRRETVRLQASVLTTSQQGRALAQQQSDLSAATAETGVTGPGLSVTVDDAPKSGAGQGSSEQRPDGTVITGRVQDRDLQELVNALWAAGAEAVSVGGIRLSPTTAIRTAGETVLADYRPLTPPYVLLAVGDPGSLETAFRRTGRGITIRLGQQGSPVRVTRRTDLRLPAAAGSESGVAAPLPGRSSSSGSAQSAGSAQPSGSASPRPSGAHS